MKLYTSYYANYRNFPANAVQVAISLTVPTGFTGKRYMAVAPNADILREYKNSNNIDRYVKRYKAEVLDKLDQDSVIEDIYEMVNDDDATVIFLCYEGGDKFCHRHNFARWLQDAGYACEELV